MDPSDDPRTTTPSPAPFQFGLRWLFGAIALVAVFLAIWIWSPEGALLAAGGLLLLGTIALAVFRPDWRWTAVAIGAAIILGLLAILASAAIWDGERRLPVTISVVDQETGKPIPNATVRLQGSILGAKQVVGQTDLAGSVTLLSNFPTSGTTSLVYETAFASVYDYEIAIDAQGYTPVNRPLWSYSPNTWEYRKYDLEIVISLEREKP